MPNIDTTLGVRQARIDKGQRALEQIFDTALIIERRRRAFAKADPGAAFLMDRAVDDLLERLGTVERRFAKRSRLLHDPGRRHRTALPAARSKRSSASKSQADFLEGACRESGHQATTCRSIRKASTSSVSLLSLQEANDVPGALIQIRRALRPDGLFLGAMAGAGTLAELRESLLVAETEIAGGASPRVIPFADVRDVGGLLQRAGFALPVTDVETVTVRYDTMFGLIRDLRAMGATNALQARSRRPGTRRLFQRAAEIYAERFSDPDGRVRATFSFIWMSGWAPHASQQQPLEARLGGGFAGQGTCQPKTQQKRRKNNADKTTI